MMLTIFGLPPKTKYNEVKALIKQECNLIDFILDNLVDDGSTSKKVRIGLSDDNDCYRIIKNLDGFRMSATHVLKVIPVGKASQSYDQRSNYQNPARPDFPPQRSDYPAQPSKTYGSQGSAGPQRQFPDSRQNAPETRSFPPSRTDLGSTSSRPTPSFNQVRPEYQHGRQDAPSFQGRSDTSSSYRPDAGNFQVRPDTGSSYMGRDTRFESGRPDNRPDVHSRPDLEMHRSQVPATHTSRMDIHQDRLGPRPTQGLPERPGMVDNRPQPWTGNMNANNSSFKEVPGSAPGNFNMPQRNMGFNEQSSIPQTPTFSSTRPPLDVPYGFPNKNSVPDISTTRPALRAVEIVDTPARPPQPQPYSNNKPITIMKDNFQGPSHYNISGHSIQPLSHGAQSQGSGPQPWASQATQQKPYDKPYDERRFPADKRLEAKPQTIEYDKRQPFDPRSGRNASPNRSFPEKFPDKSYLGTDRRTSPHGRLNAREPSPTHNPSARRVPSPIRRPGSPNRRPISPGRRQMPNDGTRRPISPGRRHISPNRRNPSPARHHISPNRRLISPNRRPMSPTANRRLVSPNRRVISPNRRPMSPSRRPISPNRRQMSPTRRVISPGRRQLADDRRDDRRMSPSDRRQPVPREDPARRYSPHKRASPSRRDDTQRPRFSPRRQIDSDKFMDTDKPKSIRPAYETMAPNQYSSGYRPNVHENIQYPRQERINPWEKDKDKTYRVMKKDEREGEAARSPARKSRSRSPVKDRFRRDSPSPRSPRSPRRSWALERRSPQRRRSPDQLRSPPPPPAWPDRQDRPDRPDRPNRIDRLDRPDRIDRQERPDRIDRPERTDRQDRSDRPDRIDRPERPDRIDRQDRSDRIDRPDRIDRNDHIDRPDRVDRPHPVDLPERPDRWPIESYRANIDRDFQDIYERAREFSKKAEELRKSAGEKRREEFESRRQEDQQRPRTSNDRPNIDYQRQEPQEKRSRFEKIEPNERRKPILPTSVKTKRDRATDEVVNKILERYDMKPDTAARVNEELKSVVSNIMYDMFGERDVSFIELVIKYQGKYTDKDEEKMVNDAIMNLPPTYRSGVKRKMQDESEVPAKMSRASPKMKEESRWQKLSESKHVNFSINPPQLIKNPPLVGKDLEQPPQMVPAPVFVRSFQEIPQDQVCKPAPMQELQRQHQQQQELQQKLLQQQSQHLQQSQQLQQPQSHLQHMQTFEQLQQMIKSQSQNHQNFQNTHMQMPNSLQIPFQQYQLQMQDLQLQAQQTMLEQARFAMQNPQMHSNLMSMGIPQMPIPLDPSQMSSELYQPMPYMQPGLDQPNTEDDSCHKLFLCQDDFEPFTDIQADCLKNFLVSKIILFTETNPGWAPDFTLKGLQSSYRYELTTADDMSKNWLINLDFSEFQYFNVLVYTKEELWYERAAIWLPGHSRCKIEPFEKLRLQNRLLKDVNIEKWKCVKKIVTAKGTRLYVDMPPSSARALESTKMMLSYELTKVNVFLKAVAVDKNSFDAGLKEPSITDPSDLITAVQNSPMPSINANQEPDAVKISLNGTKSMTIEQARKIKEIVVYNLFKYHEQGGNFRTDFVKYGFCPPNYFCIVPDHKESKRWLLGRHFRKLNRQTITVVGGEADYFTMFAHIPNEYLPNKSLMIERMKQSNQGIKGLNFHLWKVLKCTPHDRRGFVVILEIDMESLETLAKTKYQLDYVTDNSTESVELKSEYSISKLEEKIKRYKSEQMDSYDVANMDLDSDSGND